MKTSKFNSRSERERERESNLSSVSSLKKSFTLIELSIVLLILSLLVGSLLVGRQIVDRAKIQRIIFEFDYYEKAFHQFYDTYRFVPGNLSEKNCRKYSEFQIRPDSCTGYVSSGGNSWVVKTTDPASKLIPVNHRVHCFLMKQLVASKIVEIAGVKAEMDAGSGCVDLSRTPTTQDWQGYSSIVKTSFDNDVNVTLFGFPNNFLSDLSQVDNAKREMISGANTSVNPGMPHEFDNKTVRMALAQHNVITMTRAVSFKGFIRDGMTSENPYGAFSAKIASELDAKIDDGRPGTGRVLGIKAGLSVPPAIDKPRQGTADEQKQVCFDQLDTSVEDINKAIYHSSTDLKYGCNIIKVMEDVK